MRVRLLAIGTRGDVQPCVALGLGLASRSPSRPPRTSVLTSCEAFENYPPGIPGRAVAQAARIPGGIYLAFQLLWLRPLRRLPMTWGWMSKRPVPDKVMDACGSYVSIVGASDKEMAPALAATSPGPGPQSPKEERCGRENSSAPGFAPRSPNWPCARAAAASTLIGS
jgi:hypothetical protein